MRVETPFLCSHRELLFGDVRGTRKLRGSSESTQTVITRATDTQCSVGFITQRRRREKQTSRARERGKNGTLSPDRQRKVTPANFAVSGRAASRCGGCTCRGGEAPCVSVSGWRENGPLCVSSLALRGTKYFSAKGCKSYVVPFDNSTFRPPGYIEISTYN